MGGAMTYRRLRPGIAALSRQVAAARRVFQPEGALPQALLIGAQKAGTTSLFRAIAAHSAITPARQKEIHFFDENWSRGESWYRRSFPAGDFGFEATPAYLFHPHAARRAAEMVPHARLIVVLRDPVARAMSHHRYETRRGYETLPFAAALAAEARRTDAAWAACLRDPAAWNSALKRHSYLRRGQYAEQIARWRAHFPAEQMLILEDRDLHSAPGPTLKRVFAHLGLPAEDVPFGRANATTPAPPRHDPALYAHFAADGAALTRAVGARFSWLA